MSSFIAAIALQQLRDMEALQRDLGRRRGRRWWHSTRSGDQQVAVVRGLPIGWAPPPPATTPPKSIMQ